MKIIRYPQTYSLQLITMPRIFPINCYIILENDFCTLIDCSKNGQAKSIIKALEETDLPLKYIVITHAHSDHTGDLTKIKDHFPQAKICIGRKEFEDSSNHVKNINMPVQPDLLLDECSSIGSLSIYETPGHTNGSISLIDRRNDSAYVGDLLQTRGGLAISGDTRWLFPFPALATNNRKEAIQSVKKLTQQTQLKQIFCGHGAAVTYNEAIFESIIQRAENNL
ncbi:MBL fold metallo-hydrolase [Enterococcus sp. CWB-B31]|uniref:MBL fold metallo-hydrolase n=1 Tax=Enterococcus sp. CWB-B31 TaxID=2885159 RepID=UPI001E5B8A00|nr:MBL fold metallo-hydrolase [Enterococcus sp. CWB-B31]MCB5953602.1 MBL fold metallo-hydrolase [Enterococcus sp. CWB-B31]